MKKITLSVALLLFGGGYFANAQVGIGTPTPATSSMLDIVANDKGVLIPRVELTNTTTFFTSGTQVESLLVYNTKAQNDVTPGFYYWVKESATTPHWERIVNQTQLDEVIKNLGEDLTDIKNLLNYIVPTNPINTGGTTTGSTTVVYDPTTGAISYVSYSGGTYTTTSIDLTNLIKGAETKTFFRKVASEGTAPNATNVKYYYFSEQAIQDWLATPANTDLANMPVTAAGVFLIDAVGDVVNNFESVLNQTTNYGGETLTIEQIINKIAGKVDGNVIYKNIGTAPAVNWVFQYWDGTKYETIDLGGFVRANETQTFIKEVADATTGNIQYLYFSEKTIQDWLGADDSNTIANIPNNATGVVVIDASSDVVQNFESILSQETVYNGDTVTIEEIINEIAGKVDGNVIYKNVGTEQAPNWVFQYWDGTANNGAGDYVTISLGDTLVSGTAFKTKDTLDGKAIYVYHTTTSTDGTNAKTTGVALPAGLDLGRVLSITMTGVAGTSSVTDVKIDGLTIKFNTGSGMMYTVLPAGTYKVVIEFTEQ